MRKRIAALALASVMALSLFGCGAKSNSASSAAGVSGDFTGTAKGMGGDVTVTLTLTDSKITGCTAEGADETQGIGTLALEQLPGQIAETAFAETMNTWNGYVEAKNDPDFGRTSFANPLNTAPYYAIKVTAGVHHTMGGLKINTNTEVLKADGSVIPGLFAAGEVTGGVHGANRLGGNAVADFTVFGRIAGAAASKYAA